MTISFLVTYYNQKEFVARSLDSIAQLELDCEYEILIGDDGSEDGTPATIWEYMQRNPKQPITLFELPRTAADAGKSIARASFNRTNLLRHAKGDYFLLLDGDDCYCDKTFVKESVLRMEQDNRIVGCMFDCEWIFPDDRHLHTLPTTSPCFLASWQYLIFNWWCHAGSGVFRNMFTEERIRIVEETHYFDDNFITIYLMQFGSLYYTSRPVYSYYQMQDSIWNTCESWKKNFLNAMNYEIIGEVASEFRTALLIRYWPEILFVWQNRNHLSEQHLEDTFSGLLFPKGSFFLPLLHWKEKNKTEKLYLTFLFFTLYCRRYFGNLPFALKRRIQKIIRLKQTQEN